MELKIDETKELSVWAFPEETKEYNDELICLVKDNPNPVCHKMSCTGAKPELSVSMQDIEFGRVLVGQVTKKTITIKSTATGKDS